MLVAYGIASVVAALVFFVFARERPATPPCPPGMEVRSLVFDGFKQMFRQRNFILLLIIFFVGLGAFNAVTTWIENIIAPRGFTSTQAGTVGGLMIVGGIVGALVVPALSDRYPQAGAVHHPGAVPVPRWDWSASPTPHPTGSCLQPPSRWASSCSARVRSGSSTEPRSPTRPRRAPPTGCSSSWGRSRGSLFIFAMDAFKSPQTGSMTTSLVVIIVLLAVSIVLGALLREPKMFLTESARNAGETLSPGGED